MKTAATLALSFALLSLPALAKTQASAKAPRAGAFCAKAAVGTTAQDKSGVSLTCKADKKGKARWTK